MYTCNNLQVSRLQCTAVTCNTRDILWAQPWQVLRVTALNDNSGWSWDWEDSSMQVWEISGKKVKLLTLRVVHRKPQNIVRRPDWLTCLWVQGTYSRIWCFCPTTVKDPQSIDFGVRYLYSVLNEWVTVNSWRCSCSNTCTVLAVP